MRRTTLALAAAILWIGVACADETPSLADFVRKHQSRHAVGLYIQNKKVGYQITELKLERRDGKQVAVESSELMIKMNADGEATELASRGKTVYSLEMPGQILEAEETNIHDKQETVTRVTAVKSGLRLVTKVGARETSREIAVPKSNLGDAMRLTVWISGERKAGDSFSHFTTNWDQEDVDTEEVLMFKSKKKIVWGGISTDVYDVTIKTQGINFEAEILVNGSPVRGKLGGLIEMRAESEKLARQLDSANIDMVAASSIKVDRSLGNSKEVTALKLEIVGVADLKIPLSHRQTITKSDGKAFLELKQDFVIEKPKALSDADRKKFTQHTPTIQSDQESIRTLAAKIVGDEQNPLKKADKLKSWVYANLRKSMASNASTALAVLDNKAGDCTEHTLLFVSLARAAGLPARELTGVAYVAPIFGWHAWAEIHDGRQWVSVDPTWDELFVDATHIVFSEDEKDQAWMNILGQLKFKALKIEKKSEE